MEKLQTSLDNLLETSPNIPLDVKVHLLTGTAQRVGYLHSQTPPIAHRDLTARNILIDSGLSAKIANLGVARMVNIQPGQLAATITAGPGNNLYMPPETVQEEGATRYNTAIDIFSFGVVSLFTLTQTFPRDFKPSTYHNSKTRKLVARSEIERHERYIQSMQADLCETRQRDVSVASPKKVGPITTTRGCTLHTCLLALIKIKFIISNFLCLSDSSPYL